MKKFSLKKVLINQKKALTEPSLLPQQQLRQLQPEQEHEELNFGAGPVEGTQETRHGLQPSPGGLSFCRRSSLSADCPSHTAGKTLWCSTYKHGHPLAQHLPEQAQPPPPAQEQLGRTEHVGCTWHHSGDVWGRCSITLLLLEPHATSVVEPRVTAWSQEFLPEENQATTSLKPFSWGARTLLQHLDRETFGKGKFSACAGHADSSLFGC